MDERVKRSAPSNPGEVLAEFVRSAIVAYVLARLIVLLRVVNWKGTLLLAGWAWLGFHVTLLLCSVVHRQMPLKRSKVFVDIW